MCALFYLGVCFTKTLHFPMKIIHLLTRSMSEQNLKDRDRPLMMIFYPIRYIYTYFPIEIEYANRYIAILKRKKKNTDFDTSPVDDLLVCRECNFHHALCMLFHMYFPNILFY